MKPPKLDVGAEMSALEITGHIFLCDGCGPKDEDGVADGGTWDYLAERTEKPPRFEGVNGNPVILRTKVNCFGFCAGGPIAYVQPSATWYHSVTPEVMGRILDEHLGEGKVVESNVLASTDVPR